MPELNRANRQVCDVMIRDYKTKTPFLNFDTANTTTANISGDSVYAMAKGTRKISFANPVEGTMTIEAQVYPFKLFSLFSDGTLSSTGIDCVTKKVKAATAGSLTLSLTGDTSATIITGSVGVWKADGTPIEGTFADATKKFTATETTDIAANTEYEISFLAKRTTGVQTISIDNSKLPKDYFITMSTVEKDTQGTLVPYQMTAYKATPQRNFEVSFSSEGDPASVTLTFDLLEDDDEKVFDMTEITTEIGITVS